MSTWENEWIGFSCGISLSHAGSSPSRPLTCTAAPWAVVFVEVLLIAVVTASSSLKGTFCQLEDDDLFKINSNILWMEIPSCWSVPAIHSLFGWGWRSISDLRKMGTHLPLDFCLCLCLFFTWKFPAAVWRESMCSFSTNTYKEQICREREKMM